MKPLILATSLLCLLLASSVRAEHYQLVTEEWAPYNYMQDGELTGLTTDIVRAIMALTGDHFDTTLLPSMRATFALRNQPRTIMYSLFRTPEREALYKWVGPIVEETIYPYQLAGAQPQINTLEQLRSAPYITTRQAGLLPETLARQGFTNLDKSAANNHQLYRMLVAGRTGIIAGDPPAGVAYYLHQLNIAPDSVRQIPVQLYRSSLYIAFSRDSDDRVVQAWAQALEELRRNGELARIQQRYEVGVGP